MIVVILAEVMAVDAGAVDAGAVDAGVGVEGSLMRSLLLFGLTCFAVLNFSATLVHSEQVSPLQPVTVELNSERGLDDRLWGTSGSAGDRQALLQAIDRSLGYLASPAAATAYRHSATSAFTVDRVYRSLARFRLLLQQARSPEELRAAVLQEFTFYQSTGKDGQGSVGFTGYFEPTYAASRLPTPDYRYPL